MTRKKLHTEERHSLSKKSLSRRLFMGGTAAMAAATVLRGYALNQTAASPPQAVGAIPPGEKLNVAAVGVGGMGFYDIQNVGQTENIVALCDVDHRHAAKAFAKFPQAKVYTDFRVMLEKQKDIDAVMVATPDHNHAIITMAAMRLGKHVFCQKPLTHSVHEARQIGEMARASGVATQMGNQGQASEEARLVHEMILDGVIGDVTEIHAWSNRKPDISQRGIPRPADTPPVPEGVHWDLWLGPAPTRPYHPIYMPFAWRSWWDFGTGVLGDIGCHQLSTSFKALKLGHPTSVEACSTNWQRDEAISNETAPLASMVRYKFPAIAKRPALDIVWYDGGMRPERPAELEPDREFGDNDGILYVGTKGKILNHRLIPETRMREYGVPPRVLPRSPGHYIEWINACKGGEAAGSNFVDHAALLAEVVLLGNIAIRMNRKLDWDPTTQTFPNCAAANAFVAPPYREGWRL